MVFIEEVTSKYGFHSFLFEELEVYDDLVLKEKYHSWLAEELGRAQKDIDEGRVMSAEEAFCKVKYKNKMIFDEKISK